MSIITDSNQNNSFKLDSSFFDDENEDEPNSADNDDLTMDTLPEFTRFTQTVPISLLDDLSNNLDFETFINDINLDDEEANESANEDEASSSVHQMTLFAQTNSRLKLIVLAPNCAKESYQIENIIRIWQNIVSNFSNLEYELMDEERTLVQNNQIAVNYGEISSNSYYSCVIDRNRMVKQSIVTNSTSKTSKLIYPTALPSSITNNMNVFYELTQAMPELSKLQISKKGNIYTYLKQNKATLSSSTLQQHEKKSNEKNGNNNSNEANNSSKLKNFNRTDSIKSSASLNSNKPVVQKTLTASNVSKVNNAISALKTPESDRIEYEFVEKQVNLTQEALILASNQSSSINKSNNISDLLQYGDVFFRCDSIT